VEGSALRRRAIPAQFYTGKPYRGINVLLLWSSEYSSPFWLTFKQAQVLKGNVHKGEHGTPIVFYKQLPNSGAVLTDVKRCCPNCPQT
jgi:antirestriction protein ArdC